MRMEMRKGFFRGLGSSFNQQGAWSASVRVCAHVKSGLGACLHVCVGKARCACGLAVRSLKPKAPRVTHWLGLNKNKTMVVSDAGRHPKTLLVTRYASVRHANPHIYNTWLYPNWKCEGILTKKQRHFCILDNHSHILVRGLPQEKMTWPKLKLKEEKSGWVEISHSFINYQQWF